MLAAGWLVVVFVLTGVDGMRLEIWRGFGNVPDTDRQIQILFRYTFDKLHWLKLVYRDKPVAGGAASRAS